MISSQYYAVKCNGCSGRYYVYCGDPSDTTGYTPDASKCPWCGAVEWLGEECEFSEEGGDYDVGKKSLPESPPPKKTASK